MLGVSLHAVATGEVALRSDMIPFGVPGVRRNRCDVTPLPNTQENWEESLSGGGGRQEMTQVYRA